MHLGRRAAKAMTPAIALILASAAAFGQQSPNPNLDKFSKTTPGGGAILCAWIFAEASQLWRETCKIERKPIDDAINSELSSIQDFVISRSSPESANELREMARRIEQTTDGAIAIVQILNS
jgi:hypothetical protein